ncbi:hypothetical protein OPV22_024695 [Ensete ventricosum]|uniref:Uncharacterized protein n=1 Tax=Ensete ventricosum TaxID=4639 RepID=A0AAV8QDM2_ENSVE|nr:hypothetical protein OPV22_024695 [Ensete ventricosum]
MDSEPIVLIQLAKHLPCSDYNLADSKYVVYEGCIHVRLARSLRSSTVYFRAFFTNPRFLYSSLLLIHPFRSLLAPITSLSISSYGLYVVPHDSVLQGF